MSEIARILVPTDFTVKSLRIVLDFLEKDDNNKVEIVLACGYDIGDSITGLLGFTKDDHLSKLESDDFIKGCEMIKASFKTKVVEMYADLVISKNTRYLQNFFKGNRITHVVLPEDYRFHASVRACFDITMLLKKNAVQTGIKVIPLRCDGETAESIDSMDSIFFRKDWRVSYE
ncbi:hypothetical protein [Sphingobacterium sp. LRF_L2]|uniref:hypothetical protein n=1 Tax=Sphingobacterium sp. LRF_L2 TaxID=3369421 RepID=UPI003F5DFC3B